MLLVARILGLSLLVAAMGTLLGRVLFGGFPDQVVPMVLFGCVGAIIGAIAGAAREIVARQHLEKW